MENAWAIRKGVMVSMIVAMVVMKRAATQVSSIQEPTRSENTGSRLADNQSRDLNN